MSLKNFHILFITLSILLSLGFGWWSLNFYSKNAHLSNLCMGIFSFILSGLLLGYGVWFLYKLKRLNGK